MKYIVRTCAGREHYLEYVQSRIKDIVVVRDRKRDAFDTFLMALEAAGEEECVHLEDDVLIPDDFLERLPRELEGVRKLYGDSRVVNFFKLGDNRETELALGSKFSGNVCFYMPKHYNADLLHYYENGWGEENKRIHWNGYDTMMKHWLTAKKEKFVLFGDSLVQHREGKSAIDPRRSKKRLSKSFDLGSAKL